VDGNPLQDLRLENSSGSGTALKTTWNAYVMAGAKPGTGTSADVMLDWYFDRGAAFGTAVKWDNAGASGGLWATCCPTTTGRMCSRRARRRISMGRHAA
jgi:hypothetical protein